MPQQPIFNTVAQDFDKIHQAAIRSTGYPASHFFEYKVQEIHKELSRRSDLPMPRTILDFGCGVGNTGPYIRKYFPDSQIFGVDISEASISIAKEKHKGTDISYAVIEANADDFPFDLQFDLILASMVFHHVPREDHLQVAHRIASLLKPGGLFFCFELNPYHPASQMIFRKYDMRGDPYAHMLKPRALRSKLSQAFPHVSRANYKLFFPGYLSLLLPLEKRMTGIPLGAHYYVAAEVSQDKRTQIL